MGISLRQAFDEALHEFYNEQQRLPRWDALMFRGAFTSFDVVFELNEGAQ